MGLMLIYNSVNGKVNWRPQQASWRGCDLQWAGSQTAVTHPWMGAASTRLKSCTVARAEETEIEVPLSFVSSECAHLAQHNKPTGFLPFSSPHPLSMCLRSIISVFLTWCAHWRYFSLPFAERQHVQNPRGVDCMHRSLWDRNELRAFRVGIQKPVDLKVDANSSASIFKYHATLERNQPCPSNWSLFRFTTLMLLPPKAVHRAPA